MKLQAAREQMADHTAPKHRVLPRTMRQCVDNDMTVTPPFVHERPGVRVDRREVEARAPDRDAVRNQTFAGSGEERAEVIVSRRLLQDPVHEIMHPHPSSIGLFCIGANRRRAGRLRGDIRAAAHARPTHGSKPN